MWVFLLSTWKTTSDERAAVQYMKMFWHWMQIAFGRWTLYKYLKNPLEYSKKKYLFFLTFHLWTSCNSFFSKQLPLAYYICVRILYFLMTVAHNCSHMRVQKPCGAGGVQPEDEVKQMLEVSSERLLLQLGDGVSRWTKMASSTLMSHLSSLVK